MTMDNECEVTIDGRQYSYPAHTKLIDIAADFQKDFDCPIVLAIVDSKLQELFNTVDKDCTVEFETVSGHSGHKAYKRSACLLLIKSFYDVIGKDRIENFKVEFSLGAGYFCSFKGDFKLDEKMLSDIRDRMNSLVQDDIPITKTSYPLEKIIAKCHDYGMTDKERLFHYRRSSSVNMYSLAGFQDYYYGYMVPSTGYLKYFELYLYRDGLVLQLPERLNPLEVPQFTDMPHLYQTMWDSTLWGEMLGVDTVGALNDCISNGHMNELILVQEALQESRMSEIASDIIKKGNRKFVMIAGPSSSGKTTFSHRLSVELMAHGKKPHPICLDDYFVNRDKTPVDENGELDFECIEAIDVEGFNRDMTNLLNGERVEMPHFNFKSGSREYRGDFLKLGKDDILVIEGIHGLNDRLSYTLPSDSKYRIYISALTTLNVDEHNRIPTTDGRLIRRIVRDYRTRGASASKTLSMWGSVRRGEEKNIFPYQEKADAMFNSALIYELAALKQFVEPLLYGISKEDLNYQEAIRLLKFLDYFLGIDTANLPKNSIIREFVGGSCFDV